MWEKPHFYYACVKHWNRLLRELVDSLSLEIFKTLPDPAPSNLLYLTLFWLERLDLQRSIPTETVLLSICKIHSGTLKKTLINSIFTYSVVYRSRACHRFLNYDPTTQVAWLIQNISSCLRSLNRWWAISMWQYLRISPWAHLQCIPPLPVFCVTPWPS